MKTIGIIGAMDEEIAYIKEQLEIVSERTVVELDFFIGKFEDKGVVLVKSGIGKVNAAICAQVLVDHFAVDYIINVGVAGAISKELSIGDVVISSDAVQHDMDTSVFGDPVGVIPRMNESAFKADPVLVKLAWEAGSNLLTDHKVFIGRIASGDQFISTKEQKNKIRSNVNPFCAEMEGAAVAHACYLNKIPFVIIRSISDNAEAEADISYEKFVPIAAKNSSLLVAQLLKEI